MKRIANLYDQIATTENLTAAYHKARRGKSRRWGVQLFERHLDDNIEQLRKELADGTYKTSEYTSFMIHDPKERLVYRLPFRDRVVHHAIMNALEVILTRLFIEQSYSCIKGRGIHGVVRALKRDLKDAEGTQYCLKLDIRKFYPSIDHDALKQIVRRKIKDTRLLSLLDEIIDSAPGVPIGNYLSQFFANLYLTYFDHWIKEQKRVKYYYRYADDMVILAPDKATLHGLFADMNEYLTAQLHLEIKGSYQIFPVDVRGIDFVGYVFRHTHIRMRKSIKKHLCRKAAALRHRKLTESEYNHLLAPLKGWAAHCNSRNLLKKVAYEAI